MPRWEGESEMVSVWAGEHPRSAAGHKSASQKDICFAKWCVESGAVPIARATSMVQANPSLVLLFCPIHNTPQH